MLMAVLVRAKRREWVNGFLEDDFFGVRFFATVLFACRKLVSWFVVSLVVDFGTELIKKF